MVCEPEGDLCAIPISTPKTNACSKNLLRQERNVVRETRRDRIVNNARVALKKGVLFGAIGCLAATAVGAAYARDEPHLHQTTRAADFFAIAVVKHQHQLRRSILVARMCSVVLLPAVFSHFGAGFELHTFRPIGALVQSPSDS